jgi:hypothetical protein
MSPENGPGDPKNASFKDRLKTAIASKIRTGTGPIGNAISQAAVGADLELATSRREIEKSEENEWLRRNEQVTRRRRQDPSATLSEEERGVMGVIRKIRQNEAQNYQDYDPFSIRDNILSQRCTDGRLILTLWALGQAPLNNIRDGDNVRSVLGMVDALRKQKFSAVGGAEAREAIADIEEELYNETGLKIKIDEI